MGTSANIFLLAFPSMILFMFLNIKFGKSVYEILSYICTPIVLISGVVSILACDVYKDIPVKINKIFFGDERIYVETTKGNFVLTEYKSKSIADGKNFYIRIYKNAWGLEVKSPGLGWE